MLISITSTKLAVCLPGLCHQSADLPNDDMGCQLGSGLDEDGIILL